MMMIIAYIIVLGVYIVCPKWLQLGIFIANMIYPDPLPYIDEIIMGIPLC